MSHYWISLAILVLSQTPAEEPENPLYRSILAEGLNSGGTTVKLPAPTLEEGINGEREKAVIKTVAGDERAVKELMRNSVTAPFVLKSRDVKATDATIRVVDLWFVVHARLDEIDTDQIIHENGEQSVDAGNMKFESKVLSDNDLQNRKISKLPSLDGRNDWFTHLKGRLLDRIEVEATDHTVATRSRTSLIIATKTDSVFDTDQQFPNHWVSLTRKGNAEVAGPSQKFGGSISYVKITQLQTESETLFVESHLAFVEPTDWFQGNPILRSKIGVIAQDQIRRLRREIQKKRSEPKKSN